MKKFKLSNLLWGTFMLLMAVFLIANQLNSFVEIGIVSIIAAFIAFAVIIQCVVHLSFAMLPIPVAVLYVVFQKPLDFPYIQPWVLIIASVFAAIALYVMFPRKNKGILLGAFYDRSSSSDNGGKIKTEDSGNDNNPSISVSFGACSRYLHSDNLESADLYCNFGAMEIYFDHAIINPNGATVNIDCSFGAIEMYVPKHWRVVESVSCSLGAFDIDHRRAAPTADSPVLTLTGKVSLGGAEVKFI